MMRWLAMIFVCGLGLGCVQVPSPHKSSAAGLPDGSFALDLGLDASLLRPETAVAAAGHPTAPGAEVVRGDAGVAIAADSGVLRSPAPTPRGSLKDAGAAARDGAEPSARRPSAEGELLITEIMSNPAALADTAGEWIELYNPSAGQGFELEGCAFADGGKTPHAISGGHIVPAQGYFAIARSDAPGFRPDLVLPISLSNGADTVALACDGVEIDRVSFGTGFPLASGASMSLDPGAYDALENDAASAWCLGRQAYAGDLGTPGAPNPPCETDQDDAGTR